MAAERDGMLQVHGRHGEGAAGEGDARAVAEVFRQHGAVHGRAHQAHAQLAGAATGAAATTAAAAAVIVVVVAVDRLRLQKHVRDATEGGVALEPAQQHASGAEEQLRRGGCAALATHRVAHRARAAPLAALGRDALGDADGGDAPRLRCTCVENTAAAPSASWLSGGLVQRLSTPQAARSLRQPRPISRLEPCWQGIGGPCFRHAGVLRDLRRLARAGLALDDARRTPQRRQDLRAVLCDRQLRARRAVRPATTRWRRRQRREQRPPVGTAAAAAAAAAARRVARG
eukprot:scaffold97443_cov63-Phaeocystis_antarctica.AAC.2